MTSANQSFISGASSVLGN